MIEEEKLIWMESPQDNTIRIKSRNGYSIENPSIEGNEIVIECVPVDKVEEKPIEVTYKYFLPEHSNELSLHQKALSFYSALWDIDQKCRSVMKYEEDVPERMYELCEEIRTMCHESGMDEIE